MAKFLALPGAFLGKWRRTEVPAEKLISGGVGVMRLMSEPSKCPPAVSLSVYLPPASSGAASASEVAFKFAGLTDESLELDLGSSFSPPNWDLPVAA